MIRPFPVSLPLATGFVNIPHFLPWQNAFPLRVRLAGSFRLTLALFASVSYVAMMNSKHRKTLAAVFTDPVSGTIEWAAVESLLLAAGARLIEGRGSRVRFEKDSEVATFHRPHPAKEAKRYQVRDARDFLERIGVRP